jgi:hypothetical protein
MMEKDRAWGGELEMSILSKLYQCGFLIHANGRPNISVINFQDLFYQVDSCEHITEKNTYHLAYHLNVTTSVSLIF